MNETHLKNIRSNNYVSLELSQAIGNTPLLQIKNLSEDLSEEVEIFAKAEWLNPGGSVKDRPALNIIQTALNDGKLGNGITLLARRCPRSALF